MDPRTFYTEAVAAGGTGSVTGAAVDGSQVYAGRVLIMNPRTQYQQTAAAGSTENVTAAAIYNNPAAPTGRKGFNWWALIGIAVAVAAAAFVYLKFIKK